MTKARFPKICPVCKKPIKLVRKRMPSGRRITLPKHSCIIGGEWTIMSETDPGWINPIEESIRDFDSDADSLGMEKLG